MPRSRSYMIVSLFSSENPGYIFSRNFNFANLPFGSRIVFRKPLGLPSKIVLPLKLPPDSLMSHLRTAILLNTCTLYKC